jgi:hypothetical protein
VYSLFVRLHSNRMEKTFYTVTHPYMKLYSFLSISCVNIKELKLEFDYIALLCRSWISNLSSLRLYANATRKCDFIIAIIFFLNFHLSTESGFRKCLSIFIIVISRVLVNLDQCMTLFTRNIEPVLCSILLLSAAV